MFENYVCTFSVGLGCTYFLTSKTATSIRNPWIIIAGQMWMWRPRKKKKLVAVEHESSPNTRNSHGMPVILRCTAWTHEDSSEHRWGAVFYRCVQFERAGCEPGSWPCQPRCHRLFVTVEHLQREMLHKSLGGHSETPLIKLSIQGPLTREIK